MTPHIVAGLSEKNKSFFQEQNTKKSCLRVGKVILTLAFNKKPNIKKFFIDI
jgi:hypothetical protein